MGGTNFSQGTRAAIAPLTAVIVTEITHRVAAANSVFKHVGLSNMFDSAACSSYPVCDLSGQNAV